MAKYQIVIKFETDRELTPEEQFQIVGTAQVQVEEPTDEEGESMQVNVKEVTARISEA
jgi:hypothetical protein